MLSWIKKNLIPMPAINPRIYDEQRTPTSADMFSKLAFRLCKKIKEHSQKTPFSSVLLFEKGKIAGTTPYFFIQPWNEMGFLFERNSKGWVICRAEKIAHEGRFLRALESIDIATVETRPGSSFIRIYSSGFGEESVPFLIYEETIWNELFKHFIEVQNNV